nr:KinB-signaling pathway activation protein [Texcoconibacillus texcoconensis]
MLIGSTSGALIGLILDWNAYMEDLFSGEFFGFILLVIWLFGIGALWTAISQMGFFAYLTLNRLCLGMFKSHKLWNRVQVVIILFVLFDLMYFRHMAFAEEGESLLAYSIMPLFLLVYGLVVAYLKSKDTHMGAFIPALFFMVVITTIEWIPALRENDPTFLWSALVPLLIANTWQLLILHRLQEQ